jgi:hypothetical protein
VAEPLKILRSVIVSELGLDDSRVLIYNTKFNLPSDEGLFVVLSFLASKTVSSGKRYEDATGGLLEVQETILSDSVAVDVFSQSTIARDRRHEVIWALNSDAMQSACELNTLKVGDLPNEFMDLSFVEANARLNRYRLTFRVSHLERREKLVPYYGTFTNADVTFEP